MYLVLIVHYEKSLVATFLNIFSVYKEEQTYMLDVLNSLPSILAQIDQVTNKDDLKAFKLPYKENEYMKKCTKAIEAIINGNMKMKAAL